jgi:hypothetical protein
MEHHEGEDTTSVARNSSAIESEHLEQYQDLILHLIALRNCCGYTVASKLALKLCLECLSHQRPSTVTCTQFAL